MADPIHDIPSCIQWHFHLGSGQNLTVGERLPSDGDKVSDGESLMQKGCEKTWLYRCV